MSSSNYRFVFVPLQSDGKVRIEDVLAAWDNGEAFEGSPIATGRDIPERHTVISLRVETGAPMIWACWKPGWVRAKGFSGQFLDAFRSPKG